jgi:hypothetical protein
MAVYQATMMSTDTSPSRASLAPTGICVYLYRPGLFGTAILAAWSYLLLLRFIYYVSDRRAKARPPDSRGQLNR